jgi:hypothetical protein
MTNSTPTVEVGTIVFALFSEEVQEREDFGQGQELVRGVVVESAPGMMVAEFPDRVHPSLGSTTHISCHIKNRFVTAPASVAAFLEATPRPLIRFTITAEFESVEQRQMYRVSVAGAGLRATVNDEQNCELLDVSPAGMGVFSKKIYEEGDFLNVIVTYGAKQWAGTVMVRSVSRASRDRCRYGCQVASGQAKLMDGLQHICTAIQREQIRRLKDKGIQAA